MRCESVWQSIQFVFKLNIWITSLWAVSLFMLSGLFYGVANVNQSWTVLQTQQCSVDTHASLNHLVDNDKVVLYLNCNGTQYTTNDQNTMVSAYKNPKNLQCDISKGNSTGVERIFCRAD